MFENVFEIFNSLNTSKIISRIKYIISFALVAFFIHEKCTIMFCFLRRAREILVQFSYIFALVQHLGSRTSFLKIRENINSRVLSKRTPESYVKHQLQGNQWVLRKEVCASGQLMGILNDFRCFIWVLWDTPRISQLWSKRKEVSGMELFFLKEWNECFLNLPNRLL